MKQIKLKKLNYYPPVSRKAASRIAMIGIYISITLLLIAIILINKGV